MPRPLPWLQPISANIPADGLFCPLFYIREFIHRLRRQSDMTHDRYPKIDHHANQADHLQTAFQFYRFDSPLFEKTSGIDDGDLFRWLIT
jgi:hypothetical protein